MKIIRYANADELLDNAGPWLEQSEAENNVILGVASHSKSYETGEGPPAYWAAISDGGEIVGCAFRTPPHPFSLTSMPLAAIPLLVEDLSESHDKAPGLHGPVAVAEAFAQTWSERHSISWRSHMRLRIHRLQEVTLPANAPPGELREPLESEHLLLRDWIARFIEDVDVEDDPVATADRLLESGNVRIWDNDGPCSMVAGQRATSKGMALSGVYTPPEYRKRGYASMVVAAYSQELLDSGKEYCCLYTDTDNPTSNSIYAEIGYVPIRDDVRINFVRNEDEKE